MFNRGNISHILRLARHAIEPFAFFRISGNVKRQTLSHNEAPQQSGTGIAEVMRLAPRRIADKITRLDLIHSLSYACHPAAIKDEQTFFLIKMIMKFRGGLPDGNFDQMHAKRNKARRIAQ